MHDRPKGKLPEEDLLREWMRRLGSLHEDVARGALADIHRDCGPAFRKQAKKVVGVADAAEEVAADTVAALWKGRGRLEVRSSVGSYLRTMIRNRAIRWKKRSERFVPLPWNKSTPQPF